MGWGQGPGGNSWARVMGGVPGGNSWAQGVGGGARLSLQNRSDFEKPARLILAKHGFFQFPLPPARSTDRTLAVTRAVHFAPFVPTFRAHCTGLIFRGLGLCVQACVHLGLCLQVWAIFASLVLACVCRSGHLLVGLALYLQV